MNGSIESSPGMAMVKTRKKNTALREEILRQRQVVFGKRRYWIHIAIWIFVFLYIIFSTGDFSLGLKIGISNAGKKQPPELNIGLMTIGIAGGSLVAALMIYFYLLFVIPFARYKQQKRYLWGGLFLNMFAWMGMLIIVVIIVTLLRERWQSEESDFALLIGLFASASLMLSAYFFAIYYFIDLYDQQQYLNSYQQVFTDKLQAETNFLKTQINPHFLFNTLNNIYSLTLSQSPDAPRITMQLKDLIGYMVNDCAKDMVPLDGEIRFLENYVSLEKLRNKQDHTTIELDVKGDTAGKEIAPLLLVNFIENAFKHGVKAGIGQSFVRIRLYVMDKVLAMEVSNSKPDLIGEGKVPEGQKSSGIGIRNVKRRLELLYPNRYKLRINQSENEFNVHLNLQLLSHGA
jgi:two-component system LytT family sensor kinase